MSTPFFGPLNITVTKASRQLIQAQPLFPLESPGILSIPLRFLAAPSWERWPAAPTAIRAPVTELEVRANPGWGGESDGGIDRQNRYNSHRIHAGA